MKEEARNVLSGAGAGFVAALIVCPLDVTKLRIQNQPAHSKGAYRGTTSTLLRIIQEEGILGLYSGWSPTGKEKSTDGTVVCYLIDRGIWFSTYERFKGSLSQWSRKSMSLMA
jgi:solute carrier family 25 folate transporter 32